VEKLSVVGVIGLLALAAAIGLNRWYDEDPNEMPQAAPTLRQPSVQEQPVIGIARVNQNGDVMISGKALPGSDVTVLDGDNTLGAAKADEHGDWIFVPKGAIMPGTREIAAEAKLPGGRIVRSASAVLLTVPGKSE
jgi:hypothetical protein